MYRIRNEHNVRWTITECTWGTHLGNSNKCLVVDRSQIRSEGHQRIQKGYQQDAERMRNVQTACQPDKPHTTARVTFIHQTSLSGGVCSKFWTCPKLANGQNRIQQISPDTERIHRTRNGQEKHANRHKLTENCTVRYTSVGAIG